MSVDAIFNIKSVPVQPEFIVADPGQRNHHRGLPPAQTMSQFTKEEIDRERKKLDDLCEEAAIAIGASPSEVRRLIERVIFGYGDVRSNAICRSEPVSMRHALWLNDTTPGQICGPFCGSDEVCVTTRESDVDCPVCLEKLAIYERAHALLKDASRIGPPVHPEIERLAEIGRLVEAMPVESSLHANDKKCLSRYGQNCWNFYSHMTGEFDHNFPTPLEALRAGMARA